MLFKHMEEELQQIITATFQQDPLLRRLAVPPTPISPTRAPPAATPPTAPPGYLPTRKYAQPHYPRQIQLQNLQRCNSHQFRYRPRHGHLVPPILSNPQPLRSHHGPPLSTIHYPPLNTSISAGNATLNSHPEIAYFKISACYAILGHHISISNAIWHCFPASSATYFPASSATCLPASSATSFPASSAISSNTSSATCLPASSAISFNTSSATCFPASFATSFATYFSNATHLPPLLDQILFQKSAFYTYSPLTAYSAIAKSPPALPLPTSAALPSSTPIPPPPTRRGRPRRKQ
ncbi:hypothetical protein MMC30_008566 [Trapelia coarctata]|nr:hypothetical protein [Trapelia coarctata]